MRGNKGTKMRRVVWIVLMQNALLVVAGDALASCHSKALDH